jgi:antibiotic biosynthesis monooxygenase (ABM) superfamily enzyme
LAFAPRHQIGTPLACGSKLLEEAAPFLEEFHARVVRTGFEQWFPLPDGTSAPAVWKQNMLDTEQNLQAWLGSAERKTNWD